MPTNCDIIKLAPTITAGAYSDGDVLGGEMTMSGLPYKRFFLQSLTVIDDAQQNAGLRVVFYDNNPTTPADNAAYSLAAGDVDNVLYAVDIASGDYKTVGSLYSIATISNLALPVIITSADTTWLRVVAYINGSTPTYTATSDIVFKVGIAT